MLDEITEALAAIAGPGTFAVELACPSSDLHLCVDGVGPIRFPISTAAATKLRKSARPAPFGRRDETLYDTGVRDTGEIAAAHVEIGERWKRALDAQLAVVRRRLGLPEGGTLTAVLDKMLVYGRGQFFAPHQDSERGDDMVGTLVVELPCQHRGGAVVIEHLGKKKVYAGAARGPSDLGLLAFYADCHHEVQPVTSGCRVTLTYQLVHRGRAEPAPPRERAAVDRLAACVEAYFATPIAPRYGAAAPQKPDRLIYLLDHEYTERSLDWARLKSADRARVAALCEVADRLDCEAWLALADVHESWNCEEDEGWGGYGWGRYDEDDDDDDDDEGEDDGEGEHTLLDLIDSDVMLRHWVGRDGKAAREMTLSPDIDEVVSTRGSSEMSPFKSEHEGYMGNYGNTVDRWYHRAAFVMWPRERSFVLRAKASPSWAVREIARLLKKGDADEARRRARELLPFWSRPAGKDDHEAFLRRLLDVVEALDDAGLAHGLLAPLGTDLLRLRTVLVFAGLVARHGLAWGQRLFATWAEERRPYGTPSWLPVLPRLCESLVARGRHGAALAAWLLAREVRSFEEAHAARRALPRGPRDELSGQAARDDLAALLETAAVIGATAARDDLIAFLVAPATALSPLFAGALFRKFREERTPEAARALGLGRLHDHVVGALEQALAAPPRRADDWSIDPPAGCHCALCQELAAFLRDPGRRQHAWPLAKEKRRHIHGRIDLADLPVSHVTRRQGSPQTLVLTKLPALFERAAALRAEQAALLAWLVHERRAFTDVTRARPRRR